MDNKAPLQSHDHQHGFAVADDEPAIVPKTDKPLTDPVCGMKVAATPQNEIRYAGQAHHFCSARCMDKFRASPQSYLSPANAEPAQSLTDGTIYTCPMHPEVRQSTLGNCRKCGMTLEPLMPSLDEKENPELVDFRHRF